MARRRASDSLVRDYQATIRYRLSVGVGRRVWSKVPASAVEEQVARRAVAAAERPPGGRDRTALPDPEPDAPALERVGPAVVRPARRGRLGADLQQRLPGDGRAASAGELGPRVVPLRRDGGADGDACPRRGASPAPGGGHAETHGSGARRGADVDRFGDRGGGPIHLPLPRDRRCGSARRRGRAGPTRRRRAGSTRWPTGS